MGNLPSPSTHMSMDRLILGVELRLRIGQYRKPLLRPIASPSPMSTCLSRLHGLPHAHHPQDGQKERQLHVLWSVRART